MRIDGRLVGFGLFLITVGVVMIGVREGWITDETAGRAWGLWPLLIVAAGLSIALARRPGAEIGGLLLAVTLGAMVGGVASTGSFNVGACTSNGTSGDPIQTITGELASRATVELSQGCGALAISTSPGTTWRIGGVHPDGRPPRVDAGPDRLTIETGDDDAFATDGRVALELVLPRGPTLDLDLEGNAGEARIDLGGARLGTVNVERNAGTVELDLRDVATLESFGLHVNAGSATVRLPTLSVTGELEVNAGSVTICRGADRAVGLRFRTEGGFASSNDFGDQGLVEVDGGWETPGFATAAARITIDAQVNAGSLALDRARPCDG